MLDLASVVKNIVRPCRSGKRPRLKQRQKKVSP